MTDDGAKGGAGLPGAAPVSAVGQAGRIDWLKILILAVLAVLAVRALVVPAFVLNMLGYPVDYFYSEGDPLVYVNLLLKGQSIYSDSRQYPLLGNLYPPVYFWIAAACARCFGPSLATLRLLALAPLAGTMLFTGLFLRREKATAVLTAAAVLLVPCTYALSLYFVIPRVDGWMAFFAFGSLYFFASPELQARDIVCGGVLAALALFTKQTAVFGVAAVGVHLLLARPRKGLAAGVAAALACGLLLGVSLWRFGPQLLDSLTALTVRREWTASRFTGLLVPATASLSVLGGAGVARLAVHAVTRRWELLDTYLAGHALAGVLIMFEGSGINYLLPLCPALCLAAVLSVRDMLAFWPRPAAAGAVALAGLHLVMQSACEAPFTVPDEKQMQEAHFAASFLTGTEAPVFAERFYGAVADREQTQRYFVEPVHLHTLPGGRLDPQVLLAPFRERRFSRVIVFRPSYLPPEVWSAIHQNYRIIRTGELILCFRYQEKAEVIYMLPR